MDAIQLILEILIYRQFVDIDGKIYWEYTQQIIMKNYSGKMASFNINALSQTIVEDSHYIC